ncbi:MAG: hypothetical protein EPN93_02070 [Spirochaetes bacterium]|nr:MAG: hypothetical protein EPN93_02070 [Spirochaetota bacterium]
MEHRLRSLLIVHGLIATLLGLLSGVALAFVLTGDVPGSARAWHQAHLQGIMSGLLALAAGWFAGHIRLGERALRIMAWGFIVQAYGFSLGTVAGALTGHRGLEVAMPVGNIIVYVVYTAAIAGSLDAVCLALYGALKAARAG